MEKLKNKEGGFLRLILLLVLLILIMRYFEISFSDLNHGVRDFFSTLLPD